VYALPEFGVTCTLWLVVLTMTDLTLLLVRSPTKAAAAALIRVCSGSGAVPVEQRRH